MAWNILFYETESGISPVTEFIDSLSQKEQAKIIRSIDLLAEFGTSLKEPYTKPVTDRKKLFELRISISSNTYRILYFAWKQQTFVLLHIFLKKTQKSPKKELDTAEKRMKDHIRRFGQ